jgi:hypothetical protein
MSKHDDDEDIDGALEELLEFQKKVDEIAKNIVLGYKKSFDYRELLEPGASKPFAREHGKWYDRVDKELVAQGFKPLGSYEDAGARDKTPDDKRSFYRFAVSEDGTIVAAWFAFPSKPVTHAIVIESDGIDGSKWTTAAGLKDNGMPNMPNRHELLFHTDTPISELLTAHRQQVGDAALVARNGIDDILAARLASSVEYNEFRKAIGIPLFRGVLRANYETDEEFEENGRELLDSIEAHPEWWAGEESAEPARPVFDPNAPLRLLFMMSRDEATGRGHITTAGLLPRGVPELQMKGLAANHCRAARFLMGNVARKLLAHASTLPASTTPIDERLSGTRLTIDGQEIVARAGVIGMGRFPETMSVGPTQVELHLEEFGGSGGKLADIFSVLLRKERSAKLLRVTGPGADASDAWLRDATRALGMDTPSALPTEDFQATMTAASQRAVADLPSFRARLRAGLPAGQFAVVKTGLPTASGAREFVWVRVTDVSDGAFVGTLAVQPSADCSGYAMGQDMRIADGDVYDRGIFSETTGPVEPAFTDVVAQEFGVDIAG